MPVVAFPRGQKRNENVQTPFLKFKEQKRQKATPNEIETKGKQECKKSRRQQLRKQTKPSAKKKKGNEKQHQRRMEQNGRKKARKGAETEGKSKQNQVHKRPKSTNGLQLVRPFTRDPATKNKWNTSWTIKAHKPPHHKVAIPGGSMCGESTPANVMPWHFALPVHHTHLPV